MKAGAFTPATLIVMPSARGRVHPLNEGGGFHPRNPEWEGLSPDDELRSMKAGAFTPATLGTPFDVYEVDVDRSMKAGAFTPATHPRCTPLGT